MSRARGVLDTSVVIDLDELGDADLPADIAVSTLTLAELAAGPLTTDDPEERARRLGRVLRAESEFDALPFDIFSARAFALVYQRTASLGRRPRGRRTVDLLIAAVAVANGLPLYTRNPDDFAGLEGLLDVVAV